jgi:hypothetical protein
VGFSTGSAGSLRFLAFAQSVQRARSTPMNPFRKKYSCSPAVKMKSAEQTLHVKVLSWHEATALGGGL